ncbi:MAG: hypothetical protein B7Y25_01770 [Alphaproteobacteria bacterium 16-39-46]|nr:MAG: hypothetical protein B7Y25_01770 [Alphaproteobacteria bacterium 16-39-46]OZA43969.1 MAG: hypothetical protein B7X84_01755 [Alphaproteobacteria bacterium 17-39-52]HQS83452.1 hypothetical protein [Alphaproteobacteria bacterium]HQS93246.1 hypothetical protein [Alphaproteobacteria bacterium]
MRRFLVFMILMIGGIGILLFNVKYKVVGLEQELSHVKRDITNSRQSIHILKAEWEHLNNPGRLQKLAQKYLNLIPLDQSHYLALSQIPFRDDAVISYVTETLQTEGILQESSGGQSSIPFQESVRGR